MSPTPANLVARMLITLIHARSLADSTDGRQTEVTHIMHTLLRICQAASTSTVEDQTATICLLGDKEGRDLEAIQWHLITRVPPIYGFFLGTIFSAMRTPVGTLSMDEVIRVLTNEAPVQVVCPGSRYILASDEALRKLEAHCVLKGLAGTWMLDGVTADGGIIIEATRTRYTEKIRPVILVITPPHLDAAGVKFDPADPRKLTVIKT